MRNDKKLTSTAQLPLRLSAPCFELGYASRSGSGFDQCANCGNWFRFLERHHRDYSRYGTSLEVPTDVEKLCHRCHIAEHPERWREITAREAQAVQRIQAADRQARHIMLRMHRAMER